MFVSLNPEKGVGGGDQFAPRRSEGEFRDCLAPRLGGEHPALSQSNVGVATSHRGAGFVTVLRNGQPHDFEVSVAVELNEEIREQSESGPGRAGHFNDVAFSGMRTGDQRLRLSAAFALSIAGPSTARTTA